jgi:hypothetical protein
MEMEIDISVCTHELVRNERGEIVTNNNQVLIREKNCNKIIFHATALLTYLIL